MQKVPPNVHREFHRQKKRHAFNISLKKIGGGYYVYKELGVWDEIRKRERVITEYLGKITTDGRFVKKRERGGENAAAPMNQRASRPQRLDGHDLNILTAMSMNARMPISKMASLAGLNTQAAYHRVGTLERQLGIRYLLEMDVERLGYTRYVLLVKFLSGSPPKEKLREAVVSDPRVQFAALTRGDYDLMIYLIDKGYIDAIDNIWEMRSAGLFGKYSSRWHLVPFGEVYSFVPLRTEFIEHVLKKNDLAERGSARGHGLSQKELAVLMRLNENSTKSFFEVDKECGLTKGSARYTYLNLRKRGLITRPTITMTGLPMKHLGVILLETLYGERVRRNRHKLLIDSMKNGQIANKYSLIGNAGNPAGAICCLPVASHGELEDAAGSMKKQAGGVEIETLVVTETLVGGLCYRRFDNNYSRQYKLLVDAKKIERKQLTNYAV